MYTCPGCEQEFERTKEFFHPNKTAKDGLRNICKPCNQAKKKEYRVNNADHARVVRIAWFKLKLEKDPDYELETERAWRKKNAKKLVKRTREWRAKNRNLLLARRRAKYHANPAESAASYHRRRARKLELPADFTKADWEYALQYWGGACAVCERQDGLFSLVVAMDHWIPLFSPSCPGHIPTNIVPLCHGIEGCNTSKNAKDPEVWLLEQLGKRKAQQKLKEIERFFATVRKIPP